MNRKVKFYSSLDYSDLVAELRSGEDGLEYASADALEELMGRIQELEDALEAKDKRIAELEAKFWGADENEKITASFLETTTKQRNEAYARIEDLNARVSELCIALGLLTTLNPDLEIHIDDPVEMAEKVVAHVEGCIKELEDELQEAYRVQNNLAARIGDLLDELEKNDGR